MILKWPCILRYFTEFGNSWGLLPYYVKVFENTPIYSASEMYSPKYLVFTDISLMAIFAVNHPRKFDIKSAITWKRYKMGGKLVLITNRKSHMSFRLIPKSVTLNDLERRYGHYFALFRRIR